MEVLLLHDHEKLGKAGEIIKVSSGYARNFLIPKSMAMIATPQAVKRAEEIAKKSVLRAQKSLEEYQSLSEKIQSLELSLPTKVGQDGKLYGRITNQDVAKALAKEGIVIDKRKVLMDQSIKETGQYQAKIKLHPQVETVLKISIVSS